jgi:hypothetical protein
MKITKYKTIFLLLFIVLSISACRAGADQPSLIISTPESGKGGIVGKIEIPEKWEDKENFVYLAQYYAHDEVSGNFILEPERFPKTLISKRGEFFLNNLEPGNYVLIIGPQPEIGKLVMKHGVPVIVEVKSDQINELSELVLAN